MLRRRGRMPSMVTAHTLGDLSKKPNSELASIRADLGSLMAMHGATVTKLRVEADAITAILHERERPGFEVSDHAVVRWLEKVKGVDMDILRQEIAAAAIKAKVQGGNEICRAKGDAVAYTLDGLTFIVAHRNNIVTIVVGRYENPATLQVKDK